ncbi:precorrin-2 dehydrogenase/sirohydrochlorin ferrochelatase family protein [Sulfobacillus thermosulfidooxidans]|uniref:precorrin-2 dehydrogenase/sirohydrochlorin ferrochelatase family protein n=1 Tax=Sulfobacillus thermosulfidooxidans TaxID=28034 RepID=UPI0006B423BF|nr:bifunctional precorrin-2 dehydrogenase/sirohydrochlorin ferrochelatase [Sulfobacillus thermosulfidooxidans]
MGYVPILLDVNNLRVLFVGGGQSAYRKLPEFLDNGAIITIVSPTVHEAIYPYIEAGQVKWRNRTYHSHDLQGIQCVMACTNDPALNQQIVLEARRQGILAGNVSPQGPRDFQMMAVLRRESFLLAASTMGQAPLLAPILLEQLSASVNPQWSRLIAGMHRMRQDILDRYSLEERSRLWGYISTLPLWTWLERGNREGWTQETWDEKIQEALESWRAEQEGKL